MAQILNLSKIYSKTQIEEAKQSATQYDEPEAGGYVCKIVDAILNEEKQYILLNLDIAEGKYAGYYQRLEDRAGFWGLRCYASYKEKGLKRFIKICTAFEICNPGFTFDPFRGKGADVDTLKGKNIGYVFGYEEYEKNDGTIGTRPALGNITEIKKLKKYKAPELKKLNKPKTVTGDEDFMKVPEGNADFDSIDF